jgi:hypothetical protein
MGALPLVSAIASMPYMSLPDTISDHKPDPSRRLSAKLKVSLDCMVWEGLTFDQAARKTGISIQAMRSALSRPHVMAYVRTERQVFRESLSTRALTRIAELSDQNDNLTAAVTATRALLDEPDQELRQGTHRHAPGLVVQIINHAPTQHVSDMDVQVIDIAVEKD